MDPQVDERLVRHIAKLARLKLTDPQIAEHTGHIAKIIEYFRQIERIDTRAVSPLTHTLPLTNVTAADVPRDGLTPGQALANAPATDGDFFRVPPVLDSGAAGS